jgi:dipeptidyl aminopeptidase/acylaminoacyl peptidase
MTTEGWFYADGCIDARRERLLLVREDHTRSGLEPVNTLVSLAMDGSHEAVIVSGADFYSDPIISPDGRLMAWLQWRHPNMPWDGTELWLAEVAHDGALGAATKVAGGTAESIFQPLWSARGELYFVSDRSGWWNLYCTDCSQPSKHHAVYATAAEYGKPQWTLSAATYAVTAAGQIAASYTSVGRWHLALIDRDRRSLERLHLALEPIESVKAAADAIFFIGASPTEPPVIARLDLLDRQVEVVRSSATDPIDSKWISVPSAITFRSDGRDVHAFHYAPANPDFSAPAGERPPLLVLSHGGPTDAAKDIFDGRIQFWTSRGFAVVDVNYGGSSGFGRAYRERLNGQWGVVDVADCVNAAKHLAALGKADPARLIIRGGSAGGYTTLAALTFHETFGAGASYYGISDIEVLARDTHKFESRYLDSLIGPYPAAKDLYVARSPIHFTDRLSCPLILFQGLEDKVVPPNQSEMMADAVRRKGLPVAYVAFAGEQHGFRKAETIVRSLEAELYFYGAIFGFHPADPIEPVAIDNLR